MVLLETDANAAVLKYPWQERSITFLFAFTDQEGKNDVLLGLIKSGDVLPLLVGLDDSMQASVPRPSGQDQNVIDTASPPSTFSNKKSKKQVIPSYGRK